MTCLLLNCCLVFRWKVIHWLKYFKVCCASACIWSLNWTLCMKLTMACHWLVVKDYTYFETFKCCNGINPAKIKIKNDLATYLSKLFTFVIIFFIQISLLCFIVLYGISHVVISAYKRKRDELDSGKLSANSYRVKPEEKTLTSPIFLVKIVIYYVTRKCNMILSYIL